MKLTLAALIVTILAGLALGGSLANLAATTTRLAILAVLGLALQVLPVPGRTLPLVLLYTSFVVLFAFAVVNRRLPGMPLIMLGIALNFAVIAANGGMPVTRAALVASGQQDSLSYLIHNNGPKHHLATADDVLVPLADVIPIRGVDQAVSVGDVATYSGVMWLVLASMRRRRRHDEPPVQVSPMRTEQVHVGS